MFHVTPRILALGILVLAACGQAAATSPAPTTVGAGAGGAGGQSGAGGCGHQVACQGSRCTPELLAPGTYQHFLGQDEDALYAVRAEGAQAVLVRIAKKTGLTRDLVALPATAGGPIAAVGGTVYYVSGETLLAVGSSGGPSRTLFHDVANNAANLVATPERIAIAAGNGSTVVSMGPDGGGAEGVWSYSWWGGAGGAPDNLPGPTSVATAGTDLVILGFGVGNHNLGYGPTGVLARVAADDGGAPEQVAAGLASPAGLAVDGNQAFFAQAWTGDDQDGVYGVDVNGGKPARVAGCCQGYACQGTSLVVESDRLFALTPDALYVIARKSGATQKVAEPGAAATLVGDACSLYWVAADGVVRTPKPAAP